MNIIADNSFNYKTQKIKSKYECRADGTFFFYTLKMCTLLKIENNSS